MVVPEDALGFKDYLQCRGSKVDASVFFCLFFGVGGCVGLSTPTEVGGGGGEGSRASTTGTVDVRRGGGGVH